tara:strand:- start:118 stop:486 length:369 start_codon:yes stop_codon:yes gene_type:complete
MKILTKEQLEMFVFPKSKHQNSGNQKVISGIIKNPTQAIILSTGINSKVNTSFVDIRLWVMDNDAEKYVPTQKGIRLTIDQYAAFCTMIQDKFPVINDEEISIVPINSLLEQEKINNQHTTT